VFSAEIDVVRYKRLYPRSLLTPFTDNVELTSADRRTYSGIATAQQFKGFESVTVDFDSNGHPPATTNPPPQNEADDQVPKPPPADAS